MSPPGLIDNFLRPGVVPSLQDWAARRPLDLDEMATVVSSVGFTCKTAEEKTKETNFAVHSICTESFR